jgi:hypothetical protein
MEIRVNEAKHLYKNYSERLIKTEFEPLNETKFTIAMKRLRFKINSPSQDKTKSSHKYINSAYKNKNEINSNRKPFF